MARRLTLTRLPPDPVLRRSMPTFRSVVSVDASVGDPELDTRVFVFIRAEQPDASNADIFLNVATPADLAEYPVDAPAGDVPYFLKSSVALQTRSLAEAEELWEAIKSRVASLCEALDRGDELGDPETVDVP